MSYFVDGSKLDSLEIYHNSDKYKVEMGSMINSVQSYIVAGKGKYSNIVITVEPIIVTVRQRSFLMGKGMSKQIIMFKVTGNKGSAVYNDECYYLPTGDLTTTFRFNNYLLANISKQFNVKGNTISDLLRTFNESDERLSNFTVKEDGLSFGYQAKGIAKEVIRLLSSSVK